jgi:KAP family P-loop domain
MNRYIFRRWIDIFVLAIFGAAAAGMLTPVASKIADFLHAIAPPATQLYFLATTLLVAFVFGVLFQVIGASLRHVQFIHRYPSVLVAPFLSVLLICACQYVLNRQSKFSFVEWAIGIGILASCSVVAAFYNSVSLSHQPRESGIENRKREANNRNLNDWEALQIWIKSECPVEAPQQDAFGHEHIARRLASRLLASARDGRLVTIGLMGPFGSGKTTLLNLVQHYMGTQRRPDDPHVWLCRASCWGFDDSSAALGHVLSIAISVLNKHVDCCSVISLPENYRNALSAGGSWWQLIAEGMASSSDPTAQLARLKPILSAVNARLIIAVEDVDRNESRSFDPHQIEAMLQRIRDVHGITFVLSAGSTHQGRLDFAKLCEYTESLPSIGADRLFPILENVRKHCLYQNGLIDPAPDAVRRDFEREFLSPPHTIEAMHAAIRPGSSPGSRALLSLLRTPRTLKHTLRHTLNCWEQLKGEIDFDDLLITNVLRYGAPEAFDFLVEHVDGLRSHHKKPDNARDKQALARLGKRYRNLWRGTATNASWNESHALQLLFHLVPSAMQLFGEDAPTTVSIAPQSVRHREPNDYWRRILAEEIPKDELRDQDILQLIEQVNRGMSSKLALSLVTDERCPKIWEHFSNRIRSELLLPLAADVIRLVLQERGSAATGDIEALVVIWRRANRRTDQLLNPKDWLIEQVRIALPRSIRLCNDLYYYWASRSYGIVTFDERNDVRRAVFETANEVFQSNGAPRLIEALDKGHPFALYHLIFDTDQREPRSILCDAKDWTWLGPAILDAVILQPDIIVPQLVCLVGKYSHVFTHDGPKQHYEIDHAVVTDIFGDQSQAAYQALTHEVETESTEYQLYLSAANEQARKWLLDNTNENDNCVDGSPNKLL